MLKDIEFLNVYDSSDGSITDRLIIPALRNSRHYRRGVGYFSSSWLAVASDGLVPFIEAGGKAEFIVSPFLSEADWDAICLGEKAKTDEEIAKKLGAVIKDIQRGMQTEIRNALSWMVYMGVLEIRLAIPRRPTLGGMYHDKVGILYDANGDSIAFHGSLNDSRHGTLNGEAFTLFRSWREAQHEYWQEHQRRLDNLWENRNGQFAALELPAAIREGLCSMREGSFPPYNLPKKIAKRDSLIGLAFPELRSYQEEAVDAWMNADAKGIFEMATGTGKTIAALACAHRLRSKDSRIFAVIVVPYLHLMSQWATEVRKYIGVPVLCGSSRNGWRQELTALVEDFNIGATNEGFVIAVSQTAASDAFNAVLKMIKYDKLLLIADEMHGLGAGRLSRSLNRDYAYRLGLSATPSRWYDAAGTQMLLDYFGPVCFEMSLQKAIRDRYLVPYRYYPVISQMSAIQEEEYRDLTKQIGAISGRQEADQGLSDRLKMLLIARARLIGNASGNYPILMNLLNDEIGRRRAAGNEASGILIYCAPGSHRKMLECASRCGLRCHEFVADVSADDRQKILAGFRNVDFQVLVAIKCLDEGVDIPETQSAYICASSTNPREFIQRRGRILRLNEGKTSADIYDFIVMPSEAFENDDREGAKALLKRQLPRFAEFSTSALNLFDARSRLWEMAQRLGLIADLDKKPWEIERDVIELLEVGDE